MARGVHWLVLSPLDTAARERRYLQQLLNDPPLLGFAPIPIKPEGLGPAAAARCVGEAWCCCRVT